MEDPGAAQFDNATVEKALHKAITDQDVDAVRRLLETPGYQFPTMTHRLFLLRDDALFLRCLEYCWFLDPLKRVPSETDYRRAFGAADTECES